MKKRKATRETKNMIQTALWLPRQMHEQLKKEGGERGLGDEIRRRLQMSFDAERLARDGTTHELLDAIKHIEQNLSLDGPWHADRFAFDVFKAAITELLSKYQPISEAHPGTMAKLQTMYGSDVKPGTIGRILARIAIVACGGAARLRPSYDEGSVKVRNMMPALQDSVQDSTPSSERAIDIRGQKR